MKTKVIEFINRIQDGGAETLIKDYALLLDKEKFDVIVVCCFVKKGSAIYKILIENNVKVIKLYGVFPILCRALSRIYRKFNSLLLSKALDEIHPDVLHVHLEMLETVYYSCKHLNDVKLFYTCHNLPKTLIGEDLPREQEAAEYLIKNNDLQMIALHDDMAKEINQRFSIDNTAVIKNGIDFNRFTNVEKSKEEIRKDLGIAKDAYVIGSIGRLTYQKNPEFTIDVFREILHKNNRAILLMVGHGSKEKQIKQLIDEYNLNNNVLMLSNRNDIPELFKAMDVFIFPSRYEGLGIVLIEAQISNIPCVVSENIPKEAFQSNLITKLSLADSLENWVDMCLNPKSNVTEYGNIQDYDMNKEIKKLEELYLR